LTVRLEIEWPSPSKTPEKVFPAAPARAPVKMVVAAAEVGSQGVEAGVAPGAGVGVDPGDVIHARVRSCRAGQGKVVEQGVGPIVIVRLPPWLDVAGLPSALAKVSEAPFPKLRPVGRVGAVEQRHRRSLRPGVTGRVDGQTLLRRRGSGRPPLTSGRPKGQWPGRGGQAERGPGRHCHRPGHRQPVGWASTILTPPEPGLAKPARVSNRLAPVKAVAPRKFP